MSQAGLPADWIVTMSIACPHCGEKPEVAACGSCEKEMPSWVKYCPFCGEAVVKRPAAISGDHFAMENRLLCPDGNCIGILGADGRCVICGKA